MSMGETDREDDVSESGSTVKLAIGSCGRNLVSCPVCNHPDLLVGVITTVMPHLRMRETPNANGYYEAEECPCGTYMRFLA